MKLDFTLLAIISSHTVELCQYQCVLSDLIEPGHFEKWDCSEPVINGLVFLLILYYYYIKDFTLKRRDFYNVKNGGD